MNQYRQAEGGQERELASRWIQLPPVHMARNISRQGIFRPAPLFQRVRIELELTRRCRETHPWSAVDLNADGGAPFGNHLGHGIDSGTIELAWRELFRMDLIDLILN